MKASSEILMNLSSISTYKTVAAHQWYHWRNYCSMSVGNGEHVQRVHHVTEICLVLIQVMGIQCHSRLVLPRQNLLQMKKRNIRCNIIICIVLALSMLAFALIFFCFQFVLSGLVRISSY